ncbi:hypothetical protein CJ030_MR2G013152 [Morella rubra]|uniref:Uncharacterized protein n=1 Tax=Morella rubra TaxID=262757 RepID=A0A6A1WCK8_9ROSI|nr:hypothetical protein CJ030_MR2G013152 [Morella rubra]
MEAGQDEEPQIGGGIAFIQGQRTSHLILHPPLCMLPANAPGNRKEDVVEFNAWRKKNTAALHAIQISCSVDIQARIGEDDTAKIVWDAFAESYDPKAQVKGRLYRDDLADAVRWGKWTEALVLLKNLKKSGSRISKVVGTIALYLAIPQGQTDVVKKLVELMSEEDLAAHVSHRSDLTHVAAFGNCDMAECILRKDEKLISLEDRGKHIPVVATFGVWNDRAGPPSLCRHSSGSS